MIWIFHLLIAIIISYVVKRFEKAPPDDHIHWESIVKHGWLLKVIGLFSAYFGSALIPISFSIGGNPKNIEDWLALLFVLILFEGLGLILILESFFSKILYGAEGIDKESPWTRFPKYDKGYAYFFSWSFLFGYICLCLWRH